MIPHAAERAELLVAGRPAQRKALGIGGADRGFSAGFCGGFGRAFRGRFGGLRPAWPALRRLRLARRAAASFSGEDLAIEFLGGIETALSFAESLRYSSAPFG